MFQIFSARYTLHAVIFALLVALLVPLKGTNVYALSKPASLAQAIHLVPFALPTPKPYPVVDTAKPMPLASAKAIELTDYDTQETLYHKNETAAHPPASLIKMLTAVVASEYCAPDTVLTVPALHLAYDDSRMGLIAGEKISYLNILYGMFLPSGNDAAMTAAANCNGGKNFIILLNAKAQELGLRNTIITNPTGQDETGNVTTAHDITMLTLYFMKDPLFTRIVRAQYKTVTDTSDKIRHYLVNSNILLRRSDVVGVKTGTTDLAGENLVAMAKLPEDQRIVLTLLGSRNRFGEAVQLLAWVKAAVLWQYPSPIPRYPLD